MAEEFGSIVEYSVDLNQQEAPQPLPVGTYSGVIRSTEKKESQRGTMYAAVNFHIDAKQFPADFEEDNPQARYGTRRFCEAIGAPLAKQIDISEWVGMEAALEVTHDTFEGVTRAQINRVNSI